MRSAEVWHEVDSVGQYFGYRSAPVVVGASDGAEPLNGRRCDASSMSHSGKQPTDGVLTPHTVSP